MSTPIVVTPARLARYESALDKYVEDVRQNWLRQGEDIDSERGRRALEAVRRSMLVPERPQWMPLVEAIMFFTSLNLADHTSKDCADYTDDYRLNLRDAWRTRNAATEDEVVEAIAEQTGMSIAHARNMVDRVDLAEGRAISKHAPSGRTALYRHFDSAGVLLYVGIAADPEVRKGQHLRTSKWAALATEMTVEWFDTRKEACAAEREAIRQEGPLFNGTHTTAATHRRALNYLLERVS